MAKRKATPRQRKAWMPMQEVDPSEAVLAVRAKLNLTSAIRVYVNDRYEVIRTDIPTPMGTMAHLSVKRWDRGHIVDWRHKQAIKNEICGPEKEGVELYPAESRLVDNANQFHLWVLLEGKFPFGYLEPLVADDDAIALFNAGRVGGKHKGKQRPFEPGLPIGAEARSRSDQAQIQEVNAKRQEAINET